MEEMTSLEVQMASLHESNHYPPIENHGVIGNMKTLATVNTEGTIDFYCFPHFDSPAIFCSLLDSSKGGCWSITPNGGEKLENKKQFYLPDSNVLVTRFFTEKGVAQILDYMPVHDDPCKRKQMNCIVREVSGKSGEVTLRMKCKPTFNWGKCDEKQEVKVYRLCKKQTIKTEVTAFSAQKAKTSELCSEECDVCDFKSDDKSNLTTKKNHEQHNEERQNAAVFFSSSGLAMSLLSSVDMEKVSDCKDYIYSEFTVKEGDIVTFILKESDPDIAELSPFDVKQASFHSKYQQKQKDEESKLKEQYESKCGNGGPVKITLATKSDLFHNTLSFWRHWLRKCTYKGRWREMVHRSALVLKLLTFEETGAIIAAGTTSLPESLGGTRNWDYRYTWIRDASFTLYGLLRIGFTEEAEAFMRYLQKIAINDGDEPSKVGPLQIMYKIDGSKDIPEEVLDHLEGYKKSGPVRQGNAAYEQLQLDIYGELMDSIYLYNKYAAPLSYDTWVNLVETLNWLADNWNKPDEGIWEMRSGQKNYVYSRIMCWVAFDRGIRLADKRSFPCPRAKWLEIRDKIYQEIMEKGWNEERQAFTQAYENDSLDAANLIMPLVFFMAPNDPKFLKTLRATAPNSCIKSGGLISNGLVMRYDNSTTEDSLPGVEGSFNICTFWLIEAMTRAGRHDPQMLDDARWKFEDMMSYANHVGLFAEQTSSTGSQLGNFPQAFSHLSLISAAFNLDRVLNETKHI